ncbi:MAG TPA: hypothetical protein VGZ32_10775 [Actinocrinis sp.]|uniref:hypothetical protein n=1 Tax=Actinocrinis sp. TaxID=1920516 RepID=UPI002DDDAA28|nr:hypothetical protein [Actinocrinis sp.]HEV3170816.1 hypothetical protein [Actinocrinis sp.]
MISLILLYAGPTYLVVSGALRLTDLPKGGEVPPRRTETILAILTVAVAFAGTAWLAFTAGEMS